MNFGTIPDGPTFHFARLVLEHISSHELRDFPPSHLETYPPLLRLIQLEPPNLSRLFLFPQEFDYLVRRSQVHTRVPPSRPHAPVDSFSNLERLSLLGFRLCSSPRPSLKFRTRSSFTGELWISPSTSEDLVSVYIAETPRFGLGIHQPPDYSKESFPRTKNTSSQQKSSLIQMERTDDISSAHQLWFWCLFRGGSW
jgi:hypothetical protein